MVHRYLVALALLIGSLSLAACAVDTEDHDLDDCTEVEPGVPQCSTVEEPDEEQELILAGAEHQAPDQESRVEPTSYAHTWDPAGCWNCWHLRQEADNWCYWWGGHSCLANYHCHACNYYSGYDHIHFNCGCWTREDQAELEDVSFPDVVPEMAR
jgi:hypothetical protein